MRRQGRDNRFRPKKMIVLGITGSFGSGKTTVANIFKSLGAGVIDADKLACKCTMPQAGAYTKIVRIFGKGILGKNRAINRRKLAGIVFRDRGLLLKLNKAVHPEVIRLIKDKLARSKAKVTVLDAPLLIEAKIEAEADKIIVVKINEHEQIRRLQKKSSLAKADILRRINSQMPQSRKLALADFVIDNSGTMENTRKQVMKIWTELEIGLSHLRGGKLPTS